VEVANKVGVADIVGRVVEDLKDESEPYVTSFFFNFETTRFNSSSAFHMNQGKSLKRRDS
jgi:hypothetical protein